MKQNNYYGLEFDNKIFYFQNLDTLIFCSKVQVSRKYGIIENKEIHIQIEVKDTKINEK